MTTCTPASNSVAKETTSKPRYSVNATKDAYQVRVELPGVKKEGVRVNLEEGILSVNAERTPSAQESWKALHRELNPQNFGLRLKVTAPVDEAALSAKLEDGILTLVLPIKEAAKPRVIAVE